jgi:profilin-like protein
MSSWDEIVEERLVLSGQCVAGGLANGGDCAFYAAAPTADGKGWEMIWSEDHVESIEVDVETFADMTINESSILFHALATGTAPHGLWLGRSKFKVVQYDADFELSGKSVVTLFASRPKGGVHIVSTGTTVIVGVYSEEAGQSSGNCRSSLLKFAEFLLENGY